jgi:hypothetical protein
MPEAATNQPPALIIAQDGSPTNESLAAVIEWFLKYDERVAAIRHPHNEQLFQWKQEDSRKFGEEVYPFPSAEDRMAIGIFQALGENNSEADLREWVSELLGALQQANETRNQVIQDYKFSVEPGFISAVEPSEKANQDYKFSVEQHRSPLEEAEMIPSTIEKRLYLTACWLVTLCTAEARILGWVYQQIYGKPFQP